MRKRGKRQRSPLGKVIGNVKDAKLHSHPRVSASLRPSFYQSCNEYAKERSHNYLLATDAISVQIYRSLLVIDCN